MSDDKIRLIKRLESADGVRDIMVSDCHGAIVYQETEVCPVCKRKFEPITEAEWEAL